MAHELLGQGVHVREGRFLGCAFIVAHARCGGGADTILSFDRHPWTASRSLTRAELAMLARLNRDDGLRSGTRPLVADLAAAVAAIGPMRAVNVEGDDLNELGRVASAVLAAIEGRGEA